MIADREAAAGADGAGGKCGAPGTGEGAGRRLRGLGYRGVPSLLVAPGPVGGSSEEIGRASCRERVCMLV